MAEPEQAFIVGAQRCGTTSLATVLGCHPQVALARPLRPEPKFFLEPGADTEVRAYLARHYPEVGPRVRLRLEKSTSYLESDLACAQIAAAFPRAQIVVMLRDPVDRALSHYAFSCANGVEDLEVEAALDPAAESRPWDLTSISVSPYRYLSRGRYIERIRRWDDAFGTEAVHIVILEDLIAAPTSLADLEAALGLEPRIEFGFQEHQNTGERTVTLDDPTRARLAGFFAAANSDLAKRLGRPIDRWTHA